MQGTDPGVGKEGRMTQPKFLIYGKTGWIGGLLGKLMEERGLAYEYGNARLENRTDVMNDIKSSGATHVLNAAGVTGRPNVDWCEDHRVETIRSNVVGTLNLADCCYLNNVHLTVFATGCIFEYDDQHPMGSGKGFVEGEPPNFIGSYYSKTKAMVETLMSDFPNVCILRVRMPISSDLSNPRNFITKIARYEKVVNIPNSMTVLDEMLPYSIDLALEKKAGIFNFTNVGVMSHNEILELYKEYVDPSFTWKNFTLEEQAKVIIAPRSNNELDASKLKAACPGLLTLRESIIKYVFEPNRKV